MQTISSLVAAHKHSANHREELENSKVCGCFFCTETYNVTAIKEWIDEDTTAICPRCGIDSVIGDASGLEITKTFLVHMNSVWFS